MRILQNLRSKKPVLMTW